MTVICWDGATLAADSLCEIPEDGINLYGAKIWRTPSGLFGGAGDDAAVDMVLAWLMRGKHSRNKAPAFAAEVDFVGLLIASDKSVWLIDKNVSPVRFYPQKTAIGSGGNYAIALMATGMSAPEAVKKIIAERLAPGCGGDVQTLQLRAKKGKSKS